MKKTSQYLRQQAGDTIVEVLLVLGVLSLIVGGSAVLVSRSSRTLQATQEHSAGIRLAQGQLEYLKSYLSEYGSDGLITDFCMANNGSGVRVPVASTDASCKVDSGGANSADPSSYGLKVKLTAVTGGYDAVVTSNWSALTGTTNGTDQVQLRYRIYTSSGATVPNDPGTVCPAGQQPNPDTTSPIRCVNVPPQIKVYVRKIAPKADGSTPDCAPTGTVPIAGTSVKLTDVSLVGTSSTQTTVSDSSTTFTGLAINGTYKTEVTGVPTGYENCSTTPVTKTMTSGTVYPVTINMAIRPVCHQEDRRDYLGQTHDWLRQDHDYIRTDYPYLGTYNDPYPTNWLHTDNVRYKGAPQNLYFPANPPAASTYYVWDSSAPHHSTGWAYIVFSQVQYAHYGAGVAVYGPWYDVYGPWYDVYSAWYKVWVCP